MNDWARVLQHAKRRVNPHNFETWFMPTQLEAIDSTHLLVRVPTRLFKKKLAETYGELLQAVLREVGMPDTQLEFVCSEPPEPASSRSLAATHKALRRNVHPQDNHVTIERIQKRVAEHFGVFPPDLKLSGGAKSVVFPRQVAMYLVKQLNSASLPKIGREFGGKHHTTVMSAIKKIEARRRTDGDLNRTIDELLDSLH